MRKLAAVVVLAALSVSACHRPPASINVVPDRYPFEYDVVITNGRIVDGTGNAWFYGEIAIRGDRIAMIERRGSQRFLWNKNAATGGTR